MSGHSCRSLLGSIGLGLCSLLHPDNSYAQNAGYDQAGWYGAGTIAATGFVQGGNPDVTLSGFRPIALSGSADYSAGFTANVTIGRQFSFNTDGDLHVRLEGEYWYGQFQRTSVQAGRLTVPVNDNLRAQAGFINALVRFAATEQTRWWAGVGLGYAATQIPGLAPQTSGCQCLGSDSARGLSFRAKIQGEYVMTDSTALFAELGYVYLPSGAVSTSSSQTRYGGVSLPQIGLGVRARF